jgi:hypothetical protein
LLFHLHPGIWRDLRQFIGEQPSAKEASTAFPTLEYVLPLNPPSDLECGRFRDVQSRFAAIATVRAFVDLHFLFFPLCWFLPLGGGRRTTSSLLFLWCQGPEKSPQDKCEDQQMKNESWTVKYDASRIS